ncbi:MAG: metallophosphoesterase [Bacteroidales bacterium]|nr:metallophosphoesterase [Bacteroidales bacterium]
MYNKVPENRYPFRHILRRGILMLILFAACSDMVEYSPFDTLVIEKDINQRNIDKIEISSVDTLSFAYLSDTHNFYDQLLKAIKYINSDKTIQFVIVGGDITNLGLVQEYEWYYNIMKKLHFPFITGIGNHDYLSNGGRIYKKMFGATNFSFVKGNYKFIFFDDVVWENDNSSPNFEWLSSQLKDTLHKNILVTHIPPWSDQLENKYEPVFSQILQSHPPIISLFGHTHVFEQGTYAKSPYLITGTIEDKTFLKVKIRGNKVSFEKIQY